MKYLKHMVYVLVLTSCTILTSCTDKSQKFVGNWVYTSSQGEKQYLRIEKEGGKILIYPENFLPWDAATGMSGRDLHADYDKKHDKIVLPFDRDIQYNPDNKSIVTANVELFRVGEKPIAMDSIITQKP